MVLTTPPLQFLSHGTHRSLHADDQVTKPADITIHLERILLSDRPTTPTKDVPEVKAAQGSGTEYHPDLTEFFANDYVQPVMCNTTEVQKFN